MLKRRRPPRRLSCVRKISGASRYNFETKSRLRIKVKRNYQSGNRNDEDVPREAQDERGTKENKIKIKERKKETKKKYPFIRRRKRKIIYTVHYEWDFKNTTSLSGSQVETKAKKRCKKFFYATVVSPSTSLLGNLRHSWASFLRALQGFYSEFDKQNRFASGNEKTD